MTGFTAPNRFGCGARIYRIIYVQGNEKAKVFWIIPSHRCPNPPRPLCLDR
ncbi:hypothetical protein [Sedimentisphaera salicampi]|uniref:hypothetical protein n=1 Tax=Sedimentisphaera salicampi TaxID=1941349 RepID=UPI0013747345|nr:hypothetical protein [Sedimentisphaera salicampi]